MVHKSPMRVPTLSVGGTALRSGRMDAQAHNPLNGNRCVFKLSWSKMSGRDQRLVLFFQKARSAEYIGDQNVDAPGVESALYRFGL